LKGEDLENEIEYAIEIAKNFQCRLFINDHWKLAIKYGAYGVHLGQDDLDEADIQAIQSAGLRLGTSTHCHYEVARAHSYKPSYIACGPVWPTTTKDMPWVPHGLEGFCYWNTCLDYPLVGIGGVGESQIADLCNAGASGIAMITAITLAKSPQERVTKFISLVNSPITSDSTVNNHKQIKTLG
ncbi:MAG: hydroxymethylpyrimidine kinase/phosphomethylpyrimidine kinase/thiamine-phosphate diphosphorylase, partial [Flavobacteriales bacterium]